MASRDWLWNFEYAKVTHLCAEVSDHIHVLLQTHMPNTNLQRSFRFFKTWTGDEGSIRIVQISWNQSVRVEMESHQICRKLLNTLKALSKWNRDSFGFAQHNIKQLETDLARCTKDNDRIRIKDTEEAIQEQRKRLEQIFLQKSRELWLKERIVIQFFCTPASWSKEEGIKSIKDRDI